MGLTAQVAPLQELQIGATIPLPVYLVTFVLGYLTLMLAYYMKGRLADWRKMDFFDKTVETFFVGGVMTVVSELLLTATGIQGLFTSYNVFMNALPLILILDIYMVVLFALVIEERFLGPKRGKRKRRTRRVSRR